MTFRYREKASPHKSGAGNAAGGACADRPEVGCAFERSGELSTPLTSRSAQARIGARILVGLLGLSLAGCAGLSRSAATQPDVGGQALGEARAARDWSNVVTLPAGVEITVTLREGVPTRLETYRERGGGRVLLQLPGRQVRGTIEDADGRELVMLLPGRDRVRIGRDEIDAVWRIGTRRDSLGNGTLLGLAGGLAGGLLTAAATEDFTFSAPGAWVLLVGIGATGALVGAVVDRARSTEVRTRIYDD